MCLTSGSLGSMRLEHGTTVRQNFGLRSLGNVDTEAILTILLSQVEGKDYLWRYVGSDCGRLSGETGNELPNMQRPFNYRHCTFYSWKRCSPVPVWRAPRRLVNIIWFIYYRPPSSIG